MLDLAAVFPPTFPALVLAHLAALLSPGPDFFLIVGHSARHRLKGSALICLGIACGNAVYIALAIWGWTGLKEQPLLYRALELAGGVYLIWLGLMLWRAGRSGPSEAARAARPPLPPGRQFGVGLASALLNPKNMIFYLTLMTVIIGAEATLAQQIAVGLWMAGVVLVWDLIVAAGLANPSLREVLNRRLALVEKGSALILMALAGALLLEPLWSAF